MKRHLAVLNIGTNVVTACHRPGRATTTKASEVSCLLCQSTDAYTEVKFNETVAKSAAFWAQTPRQVREPWHQQPVNIICKSCHNDKFRDKGRSCMGHYQDWQCSECDGIESRLTETGMSA